MLNQLPKIITEKDFDSFFLKAERKRNEGALEEAVEIYFLLMEFRLNQKDSNGELSFSNHDSIIIERLSDLSQLLGWQEITSSLLEGLISLYRKYNKHYFFLHTVIKNAHHLLSIGKYAPAFASIDGYLSDFIGPLNEIPLREEILEKWERDCRLEELSFTEVKFFFANLYYLVGSLLNHLGQYREAIIALERGTYHCQSYGESLAEMQDLYTVERLRALVEKGELNRARSLINDSSIRTGPGTLYSGAWLNYLEIQSKIHLLQGEFNEALQKHFDIHELAAQHHLYHASAVAYTNLAGIQILINQVGEAEKNLDQAARIAETYKLKHIFPRVKLLNQLAKARSRSSLGPINLSPAAAPKLNTKRKVQPESSTRTDIEQSSGFLSWFEDRALTFQLLLAERKYAAAKSYLSNIRAIFHSTDSILIHCRLEILETMLAYYQNKTPETSKVEKIRNYLKAEKLLPELWQFQRVLSWFPTLSGLERENLIRENQGLLDGITDKLPVESRIIYLLNKWTSEEEFLAKEVDYLLENERKGLEHFFKRPWMAWKNSVKINQLFGFLDRYKDDQTQTNIAGKTAESLAANSTKLSLFTRLFTHPTDTVSLSFLVLPDRVVIFYYSFLKIGFVATPVGRIYFRKVIREIYELIGSTDLSRGLRSKKKNLSFSDLEKKIATLSELLQIENLLSNLPARVKKVRFIPDDCLHGFPFSMLKVNGDYLVKRFAVNIAYENRRMAKSAGKLGYLGKNALLVGISKALGYHSLPGVEQELASIGKWLSDENCQIETITDRGGNKDNILKSVKSCNIFHIACHGLFKHEAPDGTGLVLSNGEILSLKDILESGVFAHLEHITLSSCFGADHFVHPGKWVISLPETFWRSGVKSILGCLWETHDSFSITFMNRFYQYAKKYSKIEALQKTQIEVIEGKIGGSEGVPLLPFYWAGYQLYG